MKKILAMVLASAMALSMAACGTPTTSSTAPEAAPSDTSSSKPVEAVTEDGKYEIALITDIGTIDDKSFNQGTWEGVVKYAKENNVSHQYYKPSEQSDDAYLSAIELAVKGGAKVIVTPGFLFEVPIFQAQTQYPDVNFILVDGYPNDGAQENTVFKTEKNAVGIKYAEEQAGFLAGYAAVKDGLTKLGFLGGMAVPAVVRYGYGFAQGAEYAAQELKLPDGSLTLNYHYTGGFAATPEAQALAASWYKSGTEVIFACGGAVGNSAMAAAEAASPAGKVIGVDVDQYAESETVITSSMKGLGQSVYDSLAAYYAGSFPGGESLILDASTKGVEISMVNARFTKFAQADYDAIFDKLAKNTDNVSSNIKSDADVKSVTEIPFKAIKVTEVK